jgi:hypothetical protein
MAYDGCHLGGRDGRMWRNPCNHLFAFGLTYSSVAFAKYYTHTGSAHHAIGGGSGAIWPRFGKPLHYPYRLA